MKFLCERVCSIFVPKIAIFQALFEFIYLLLVFVFIEQKYSPHPAKTRFPVCSWGIVPENNLLHSLNCGVVISYDDVVIVLPGVEPCLKMSVQSHGMR
jgi:hypothetical protein